MSHVGVALTFGLIVLAMIYTIGDISGAHINPAVTIGFFAARRSEAGSVIPYVASQCAGAFTASVVLRFLFRQSAERFDRCAREGNYSGHCSRC